MSQKLDYRRIHNEAIVIDNTSPLGAVDDYYEMYIEGGVTILSPTITSDDHCRETISLLANWLRKIEEHSDQLMLIRTVEDIYEAKSKNKLGIIFHFQNTSPLETELELLTIYEKLGVKVIQLCYNTKNFVGDGCDERTDCGLSSFGVKVIKEMNRLGIVVDVTHTGFKSSLEAISVSEKPVIFSHSNVYNICPSPRNIKDEQIIAVAEKDGVIGIVGYPAFVSSEPNPTVYDLVDHIDYIKNLVGIRHIGVGIDYWEGMDGIASLEEAQKFYDQLTSSGRWDTHTYPSPPWRFPKGIENPRLLPNLTKALLERGYTEDEIYQILGGNLIRVYKEVWK